jgi:hypothetical protein
MYLKGQILSTDNTLSTRVMLTAILRGYEIERFESSQKDFIGKILFVKSNIS